MREEARTTGKAVVMRHYGPPDVLRVETVALPWFSPFPESATVLGNFGSWMLGAGGCRVKPGRLSPVGGEYPLRHSPLPRFPPLYSPVGTVVT